MLTQIFDVIPAVDVLDGRAVRLAGGRRERVTLEGGDPVELARRFAAEGAARIHLVDLDGAFSGRPAEALLASLLEAIEIPIQVGGGYRTLEAIADAFAAGADRVVVGTAAVEPGFLERAVGRFGESLVVAVDARAGRVAIEGWTAASSFKPRAHAQSCARAGLRRLLVTGTGLDGSLAGPDLGLVRDVVECGVPVLAAGGIGSTDDLRALRGLGCEGAVVGSALLAGRFSLREALAATVGA